ncbi:hypothetical protein PQ459_12875 [Chryseobacterium sp. KACC 21268]|nr:hypothetical protein PQ459_12875 [Chryseobacterium sp. KACC 21268]
MKIICITFFALIFINTKAQVGINTSKPLSTFEVHKSALSHVAEGIIPPRITADSLKLKDNLYGKAQHGAFVQITNPVSSTSPKTENITSPGYYIYDADYTRPDLSKGVWKKMFSDPSAFAARGRSGVSLLSLGVNVLDSEFSTIRLSTMVTEIGSEFIAGDQYIVSDTGLYAINYSLRFGQGLTAQLLSNNTPAAVIGKTNTDNVSTVLDYQLFGGLNLLALANVSVSQAAINHIYNLKKGDKLNFGVVSGGISLSLLGNVSADIAVYKIR